MRWRKFIGRFREGDPYQPLKGLYTLWCQNCRSAFEAEAWSTGHPWLKAYCTHCGKLVYARSDWPAP